MKRRAAVKNMGAIFGYTVATPTLLGMLQSCQEKVPYADWTPTFFSKDEGFAIAKLIDIILPKTDTPSATELNVHVFIDEFVGKTMAPEQQEFVKTTMGAFFGKALSASNKQRIGDVKAEIFTPLLQTYLAKRSKAIEMQHGELVETYKTAKKEGQPAKLDPQIACFTFATSLRNLCTWSYINTEHIGENVLAYASIPGQNIPCGDLDELTGGKAWSLLRNTTSAF